MTVHRLFRGWGTLSRFLLNFPAFFSPTWLARLFSVVRGYRADLIIVRDLPLSPAAYAIGRVLGVPVVVDMAENYPAMIADTWRVRGPRMWDYAIRNPALLRWIERWMVARVDGVLVVSEESADRVSALRPKRRDSIWVVQNTPRRMTQGDDSLADVARGLREHPGLTLLYVGGFEETRGLDLVIKSLPELIRRDLDPQLVLVGAGTAESALQLLAQGLGVGDRVLFTGWVRHEALPSIIDAADIGLVPHYVSEHVDTTLPNKVYDYMAHGKPVVVSDARTLAKLVGRYRCGMAYSDRSSIEFCNAIAQLADPEQRRRMGEAGRQAISDELSWEHDEARLVNAVRSVVAAHACVRRGGLSWRA